MEIPILSTCTKKIDGEVYPCYTKNGKLWIVPTYNLKFVPAFLTVDSRYYREEDYPPPQRLPVMIQIGQYICNGEFTGSSVGDKDALAETVETYMRSLGRLYPPERLRVENVFHDYVEFRKGGYWYNRDARQAVLDAIIRVGERKMSVLVGFRHGLPPEINRCLLEFL